MSLLKSEPFAAVTSMDELLAIASVMEQEAIAAYSKLADLMRREGRPDLVAVFERLVGEESQHLGNVERWSEKLSGRKPDLASLRWEPVDTFDDEGASSIAPELMTAYRAFAMASRNEERAFLFWTYVAAQTEEDALREAAEQMAREELGHLTTLRRERRLAFHAGLDAARSTPAADLPALEMRLADHLEAEAARNREADSSASRRTWPGEWPPCANCCSTATWISANACRTRRAATGPKGSPPKRWSADRRSGQCSGDQRSAGGRRGVRDSPAHLDVAIMAGLGEDRFLPLARPAALARRSVAYQSENIRSHGETPPPIVTLPSVATAVRRFPVR